MFSKILHFIKYHNAFVIGLAIFFVVAAAVFADQDVRDAVIGKALVERQGIDNAALLAADLDEFDMAMRIDGVREDGKNYYVDYSYRMFAIVDNVWQETTTTDTFVVSVAALSGRDLGLYVAEELGEVMDDRLSYLREVQQLQQDKGQTLVEETTTYTGLIGLVLNPSTRQLPGYVPVVEPLAMAEPFVPIEGVDEAGERVRAAESGNDQFPIPNDQTQLPEIDTVIASQPESLTTSTEAVFTFYSTAAATTFQCQVNNAGWYPCQSPQNFVNLTDGTYTLQVYAVAPDGTYDQAPAAYIWEIDTETVPEPELPAAEPEPTPQPAPAPEPPATTTEPITEPETSAPGL